MQLDNINEALNKVLEEKIKRPLAVLLKKKPKIFLSIDFGRTFIKIVYMESAGTNFKLLHYDMKKILSPEENRGDIIDFIINFLKTNSIPEKAVYLTITEPDSVIIKNLDLPAIPKQEILNAVKLELKDEVPFDLEEALIDWQIVKEYTDTSGAKKNQIIVIAAKPKTIDKYLAMLNQCELNPIRISSAPFNYAHILKYLNKDLGISALLDIGNHDTALCIYKNNKLIFLRRLTFSSGKLTQALTATLASDKGRLELSAEKAEKIKETFGIPEKMQMLENDIQAVQVISLMRPLLEELVRELRRSFDYFRSNFEEENPAILYLTGGGANLKNLDKFLNEELKVNVSKLPFPDCVDLHTLKKEKLARSQNQIVNALAAGLADAQAINLLPQEIKTQKVELIEKISLRLVAVTVGAIFFFSLSFVKLQISDYQNRFKNAKLHLQTIGEIRILKQKVDLQENLLNKLLENRVPVDGLLKLISTFLPHDIILEELLLENNRHNVIFKGKVIAGADIAESVLTEFMEDIENSSFFTEASLVSSKKAGTAQGFEIKCDLVY